MNFKLFTVDYLVIILYLLLMLGVGGFFSRMIKGGKDFFVGRSEVNSFIFVSIVRNG